LIEPLKGYDLDIDTIISILETDPKNGLTHEEVTRRLQEYGENTIPVVKGSFWQVYLAPLFNYLISVYLIMAGVLFILAIREPSIWPQVILWLSIVGANFVIAIVQQSRAQKKLDALKKLTEPTSRVIRQGIPEEIPVEHLVPGDIIELDPGDRIPADARILSCSACTINEASLTGESVPVPKSNIPIMDPDTPLSERYNMLYRGTYVQIGTINALVIRTGLQTELGQLSNELAKHTTGEIPLQAKVNVLGKWLTVAIGIFLAVQLVFKGWLFSQVGFQLLDQRFIIQEIVVSIIASMAVMPINIPLLTTITLLTGVLAMGAHKVLIRDLSAIESLGRISVLCSDKTGTITRNQMTVKRIWDAAGQLYSVTALGYGPSGVIFPVQMEATAETPEEVAPTSSKPAYPGSSLELLLIAGFLCNDADLVVDEFFEPTGTTTYKAIGDPMEAALIALFNKSGINKRKVQNNYKVVQEYPFESELKRMTKVFKNKDESGYISFSKGATEILLDQCAYIGNQDAFQRAELTSEKKAEIQTFADDFASLGFRILSMAYNVIPDGSVPEDEKRTTIEQNMTYLGFVSILDPPREGIKEAVRESLSAGITPVMITGDSHITAATIAQQVEILQDGQTVHQGEEVAELSDEDFQKTAVFARVSPQHKQIIVERYQKKNKVVAMTGDGVNDALAVSMADIGIAMGITGTDVTKQAADLIIADDSFASIVTGVREGRGLYQKIRMMILFYLVVNLAEFMVYFGASLIPGFAILNNWQRVYIFSTIHSFPVFGLIWDRIGPEIMDRKPLDTEGILNKRLNRVLLLGAFLLAGIISLMYLLTYTGIIPVTLFNKAGYKPLSLPNGSLDIYAPQSWAQAKARTMFLTTVFIAEGTLVLTLRRMDQNIVQSLKSVSWFFWLMILFVPIIHCLAMYIPILQAILVAYVGIDVELLQLAWYDWTLCFGAGLTPILILELYKRNVRQKGEFF